MQKEVKQTQTTVKFRRKSWRLKLPQSFWQSYLEGSFKKVSGTTELCIYRCFIFYYFHFQCHDTFEKRKKKKKNQLVLQCITPQSRLRKDSLWLLKFKRVFPCISITYLLHLLEIYSQTSLNSFSCSLVFQKVSEDIHINGKTGIKQGDGVKSFVTYLFSIK